MRTMFLLAAVLLLGACATQSNRSRQKQLNDTLRSYAATVRWGSFEQAQAFIEPKHLEAHPPSALDLARYRQVQVTGYDAQPRAMISETEARQLVRIDLVNVNTQSARSVVDRQTWTYDETAQRWWLASGLPDISRQD